MENLTKDALFLIAIELNLPGLLQFCATNSRINDLICKRNDIWNYKLKNRFPNYPESLKQSTSRKTYTLLYKLNVLKEKLNLTDSIKDLYNRKYLRLNNKNLTEIPKEIGSLVNLQKLHL